MRAVTLHAFGLTVYGNNDNMKKRHDKIKTFYFTVFVVKNFEFRTMQLNQALR